MRLAIFPVSSECSIFARYSDMLQEYNDVSFLIPKGLGSSGEDFSSIDGGPDTGYILSSDVKAEILAADAVYFPTHSMPLSREYILALLEDAIHCGKKVYVDPLFPEAAMIETNSSVNKLHGCELGINLSSLEETPEICDIPIPVVFVLGTGPFTNKFDIQLALRKFFQKQGYSVSQIGSNPVSCFFGFESFPDYFYREDVGIREKIIALNRFLYIKYLREKPEIMIVGVPGGVMPLNPMKFEELGDMAYLVSQAITPDAAVLCSYALEFNQSHLDWLKAICKYRLNAPVHDIVISNMTMDISNETRKCEYMTAPGTLIEEAMTLGQKQDINFFYALDSDNLNQLGYSVLNQLANNL